MKTKFSFDLVLVCVLSLIIIGCAGNSPNTTSIPTDINEPTSTPATSTHPTTSATHTLTVTTSTAAATATNPPKTTNLTQPTTTTTTQTTPSITIQTQTFGDLARAGAQVFSNYCTSCHGPRGRGGMETPVTGETSIPNNYQNAAELLYFITTTMPANFPGSLSEQEYWQLLGYLMVENNFIDSQVVFDADNLDQVPIE